jgi:hypothetical protein
LSRRRARIANVADGGPRGRLRGLVDDERGVEERDAEHVPRALHELLLVPWREDGQHAPALAQLERREVA